METINDISPIKNNISILEQAILSTVPKKWYNKSKIEKIERELYCEKQFLSEIFHSDNNIKYLQNYQTYLEKQLKNFI